MTNDSIFDWVRQVADEQPAVNDADDPVGFTWAGSPNPNAHSQVAIEFTFDPAHPFFAELDPRLWAETNRQRAKELAAQVRGKLAGRGFDTFADAHAADVKQWRRELDAILPRIGFSVTASNIRRRAVRSVLDILYQELANTCDELDRDVRCGCPHCMLVKLPNHSRMARFEADQIAYWLDYEKQGRWR